MTSFDARLRVAGQSGFPLAVEVDLAGERMAVRAGDRELANWDLDEIRILALADGFHIEAEGEEIILNVAEEESFAAKVGISN